VNGVLIKPLPYPDPDALVRIVHSIGGSDQPYFTAEVGATPLRSSRDGRARARAVV
jgi:hypothetical protein